MSKALSFDGPAVRCEQGRTPLAPATRPEDGPRVWMDLSVDEQPRGRIEVQPHSVPQDACPCTTKPPLVLVCAVHASPRA